MSTSSLEVPRLIQGGISFDDRGWVSFVNDFHFQGVKRFYLVSNYKTGFVRAWHGHRKEAKYVSVLSGAAVIGAVAIDNWERPNKLATVHRFCISCQKPSVLYIPAGYANGFMSLAESTQLCFFSSSTLEEARQDDFRFDARYWDIWDIKEC